MSRVVVIGATGGTGGLLVDALLARGHTVTAAAREPAAISVDEMAGQLQTARVDVRDPETLTGPLRDQDVLISVIASGARNPDGLYSEGTANLIAAAEAAGVTRVICTSSGGVRRDDPGLPLWYRWIVVPLFLSDLYEDMAYMEDAVRRSSLEWIIVRPAYLTDGAATGTYRIQDDKNPDGGWRLSRADLAHFLADQVDDDTWLHRAPTLAR